MIDCVTALGTSLKKFYLGEIINHQDILTTKLEIYFVDPLENEQVQTWLTKVNNNSQNIGEWQASITIGGGGPYTLNYTNCRITNVDIPTSSEASETAIGRGKIYLTIEEKVNGNSYCKADHTENLADGADYKGIETEISAISEYLQDISENFSFKSEAAGQWSHEHSVSITLHETLSNNLSTARTVCEAILNTNPPNFGYAFDAAKYRNLYDSQLAAGGVVLTPYYSENFDLESGQYTLSKSFDFYEEWAGSNSYYTHSLSHSIRRDAGGVMTVTEKGKVKGRAGSRALNAEVGVNSLLASAYARCNAVYIEYLEVNSLANLNNITITEEKNIDNITQEHSYTVSYSNDNAYISNTDGKYRRESTITAALDSRGNVVMMENVKIKTSEQKGHPDAEEPTLDSVAFLGGNPSLTPAGDAGRSLFLTDIALSSSRVNAFYNDIKWTSGESAGQASNSGLGSDAHGGSYSFKRIKTSLEFAALGKDLSYTAEYTSDPELVEPGTTAYNAGIRRISVDTEDEIPQAMNSEYAIPGWKFLIHNSNQTSLGKRTVTAKITCARPIYNRLIPIPDIVGGAFNAVNFADTIPDGQIAYGAKVVKDELLNWPWDLQQNLLFCPITNHPLQFLENVSYDFDSSGSASVTGTIQYVQSRNGLVRDGDNKAVGGRSDVWLEEDEG